MQGFGGGINAQSDIISVVICADSAVSCALRSPRVILQAYRPSHLSLCFRHEKNVLRHNFCCCRADSNSGSSDSVNTQQLGLSPEHSSRIF